jgi:hypothetical protein
LLRDASVSGWSSPRTRFLLARHSSYSGSAHDEVTVCTATFPVSINALHLLAIRRAAEKRVNRFSHQSQHFCNILRTKTKTSSFDSSHHGTHHHPHTQPDRPTHTSKRRRACAQHESMGLCTIADATAAAAAAAAASVSRFVKLRSRFRLVHAPLPLLCLHPPLPHRRRRQNPPTFTYSRYTHPHASTTPLPPPLQWSSGTRRCSSCKRRKTSSACCARMWGQV